MPRGLRQFGIQPAGQDGVDLNIVRGPGHRQRAAELRDAALARAVSRALGPAEDRKHRPEVDDLAAPLIAHGRKGRPRAAKGALEIDVEDLVPLIVGQLFRQLADAHAGIVDKDIDPAMRAHHRRDRITAAFCGAYVERHEAAVNAGRRQPGQRRIGLFGVAGGEDHRGARFAQRFRHGKAQPAVAAGDESDAPGKIEQVQSHRRILRRLE